MVKTYTICWSVVSDYVVAVKGHSRRSHQGERTEVYTDGNALRNSVQFGVEASILVNDLGITAAEKCQVAHNSNKKCITKMQNKKKYNKIALVIIHAHPSSRIWCSAITPVALVYALQFHGLKLTSEPPENLSKFN